MKYLSRFISWTMNNLYLVPNISIHNVHFNGFSTVWVCSCFLSGLISRSSCHTLNIWKASLLCGSSNFSFVVWFTEALVTFVPSRNLILKTLVTLCALEWNLSRVDPLMGFQVTWCWEALVTVCALDWLFSRVPCELSHVPSSDQLLRNSCHALSS